MGRLDGAFAHQHLSYVRFIEPQLLPAESWVATLKRAIRPLDRNERPGTSVRLRLLLWLRLIVAALSCFDLLHRLQRKRFRLNLEVLSSPPVQQYQILNYLCYDHTHNLR